jgi:hypothetical protein
MGVFGEADCVLRLVLSPFRSPLVRMLSPVSVSSHWLCDKRALIANGGLLASCLQDVHDVLPVLTIDLSDWVDRDPLHHGDASLGEQSSSVHVVCDLLGLLHGSSSRIPFSRMVGVVTLARRFGVNPSLLDAALCNEFKEESTEARAFLTERGFSYFIEVISELGLKKSLRCIAYMVASHLRQDMNTPLSLSMAMLDDSSRGQKRFIELCTNMLLSSKRLRQRRMVR